MMTPEAREEYGIASADCRRLGHIDGCPGAAGGDHELKFTGGPFISKPLDATRCVVCGHRMDDMGGCDSCAADREAEETEDYFENREGQPEFNGAFG